MAESSDLSAADTEPCRANVETWREQGYGYWLLVVAGLGIFCGCVGKSAQFPLHVWLPDAMEGPTPVSALIHAATMVAAGVYLVGRCYPIFTPEVLLVIAVVGTITLFMAATIAITATDIKRVLAYSTVSQLGYMMLALGLGGWLAGMFHLFTHAFFKSLLFLCSGSVIHATGTNEMPAMGGLRKKMPWTAGTMLVGCLAIAGAGIPLVVGLSGYYSKDGILAQALSFQQANPLYGYFFWIATAGAAITAFYMFRLWYMTFAGEPRDEHVYHHAHESPWVMVGPLVVLAFFAVVAGWTLTSWATSACRRCWSRPGRWARNTGPRPVGRRRSSRIPRSTSRTSAEHPHSHHALGLRLRIGRFPAGDRVLRAEETQPQRRAAGSSPASIDSSYTSGGSTNFMPCSSSVPRCGSPTGSPPGTSRASTAWSTAWRGWSASWPGWTNGSIAFSSTAW